MPMDRLANVRPSGHALRVGAIVALLVTAYFLIPLSHEELRVLPRTMLTGLTFLALGVFVVRQLGRGGDRLGHLVVALTFVLVTLAATAYRLELSRPEQFTGMATRLDALYFTLVTMATIGYGDIHPAGQAARALVSVTIVFDVIFVAAILAAITDRWRRREGLRHER